MRMLWFWPLLEFAAGPLLLLWWLRAWLLTPWASYVNHDKTKDGKVFMTVRRVHWYPPFSKYDERWFSADREGRHGRTWTRETDGATATSGAEFLPNRAPKLSGMFDAADARVNLTEEILTR